MAAFYGVSGDGKTAVIEMAAASGLMLTPAERRNPLLATSYGTGELILHALDQGIRHLILGIGGSATVDGGVGMVQALGGRFYRPDGKALPWGGGELATLSGIDLSTLDARLRQCRIEVACDVDNPLVGRRGGGVRAAEGRDGSDGGAVGTGPDAVCRGDPPEYRPRRATGRRRRSGGRHGDRLPGVSVQR